MKKLLLIPALILISFASCNFNRVKGNGHVVSKTYAESGFKDIDAGSAMNIYLKQGPDFSVRIDAEENILNLIQVSKDGDKLIIGFRENVSVNPTKNIKVYITAPEYHHLDGSGACTFSSEGKITGHEIKLDLSGANNTHLELDVKKLEIDASGASDIKVSGTAVDFTVGASGNTTIKADQLHTENTDVEISGAGDASVFASKSLKVDISGAGSVRYKGNPSSVEKEISGAGHVSKVD